MLVHCLLCVNWVLTHRSIAFWLCFLFFFYDSTSESSLDLFFLSFPGSGTESSSEAAEGDDVQDAVVNHYHIDEDGDEDATSDANDFQDMENEYRIDGEVACTRLILLCTLVASLRSCCAPTQ